MATKYYSPVVATADEIMNDIRATLPDQVVLFAETEWEVPVTPEVVLELKKLNIVLKIVHGSFCCDYYTTKYDSLGIDMANVEFWGTHWFNWSYHCLVTNNYELLDTKFEHPFICLNNRSHIHRCVMLDTLAKENLIDKGVVTFHDYLNENSNYKFKFFDRKILTLDDEFGKRLDSFLITKEFHNSFLHVVTESRHDIPFITEKTVKVLLFKKPFLVLGSPGFSKILTELGFKLYDELFDYSFDSVDDLEERTELLVRNIKPLLSANLDELYLTIQDKVEYNYHRAIEIIKDITFLPSLVLEASDKNEFPLSGRYQKLIEYTHD